MAAGGELGWAAWPGHPGGTRGLFAGEGRGEARAGFLSSLRDGGSLRRSAEVTTCSSAPPTSLPEEAAAGAAANQKHTVTMSDRKAVIKNADMSEEMQQDSVECATQALEKYNIEKDIAAHIKKEFDKKYNPTWHCIVGRNFGSYVTHETKHFIYFYLGQVAILLFKSG
ncbi:DYL1 protein [Podarcis lilfordi]|uniref:Dynein light chain n=1 Tax=Podarcis lilfordi TaxID=74358 RepID=A0AA35LKK1_9SAUR|nr:DYL1 protein [Podarcis lilfordi]